MAERAMNLPRRWDEGMDYSKEEDVLIEALNAGHPHVQALVERLADLNRIHLALHMGGHEDTPEHEQCVQLLEELASCTDRMKAGAWN